MNVVVAPAGNGYQPSGEGQRDEVGMVKVDKLRGGALQSCNSSLWGGGAAPVGAGASELGGGSSGPGSQTSVGRAG